MAWLGKVIGGTVGAFFGGPMGAAFGATLGHLCYDGSSRAGRLRLESLESQAGVVGPQGPGLALVLKLRGVVERPGEQRLVVHLLAQGQRLWAGHARYADADQHLVVVAPLGALVHAAVAVVRQSGPVGPAQVRCIQQVLSQCFKLDDRGLRSACGRRTGDDWIHA